MTSIFQTCVNSVKNVKDTVKSHRRKFSCTRTKNTGWAVIRKQKTERAGTCQRETARRSFKTEFYAMLGFSKEMTESLIVKKEALKCSGKIYSEQHRRNFDIKDDILRVRNDLDDESRLGLTKNRKPIAEWFREQWHKLRYGIRQPQ